jgi:hypothetical protein
LNHSSGKVNYFRGQDRTQWRTGIATYANVAYENVYPGIDLGKGLSTTRRRELERAKRILQRRVAARRRRGTAA